MEQCAVVLNGNDVVKVSNLKRKYDKIMSNPNMKILEECDKEMLDEKYNYWNRTLNRNIEEEKNEEEPSKLVENLSYIKAESKNRLHYSKYLSRFRGM